MFDVEPDSIRGEASLEAGLYSVLPEAVRFLIPVAALPGLVAVRVQHEGALSEPVMVQINHVAPGLFSANGDGRGVAAATAVRVARDGTRTPLEVSRYDPALKRHVAVPLAVRADFSPVYLTLYGTGLRGDTRSPSVRIGCTYVVALHRQT